jgi:hypothetical protein
MSYRSARVGRLVLIRWLRPDESDIEPVLAELRRARAELDGRPPIIVAIMPDDSDTPSLATGRAMASRLDDTFEIVEGIHSIIEGSSVRAIAKRLAFEAIVSVTAHPPPVVRVAIARRAHHEARPRRDRGEPHRRARQRRAAVQGSRRARGAVGWRR